MILTGSIPTSFQNRLVLVVFVFVFVLGVVLVEVDLLDIVVIGIGRVLGVDDVLLGRQHLRLGDGERVGVHIR